VYEHSTQPLLPRRVFLSRVLRSFAVAAVIVGVWLGIGILGYHSLAGLGWIDAVLNASMILSGMGPVDPLPSDGAKLFASAYAVLSGVVFLSTCAILVAPVVHRLMHHFHLQQSKFES
jgi:hypothetical protein